MGRINRGAPSDPRQGGDERRADSNHRGARGLAQGPIVKLLTLDQASALLGPVTVAMLRARVRRGELPAVKAGRSYLVSAEDIARLYAPTVRGEAKPRRNESERARIDRQLRAAGIVDTQGERRNGR
jgi:excisionase family DNA binding protein